MWRKLLAGGCRQRADNGKKEIEGGAQKSETGKASTTVLSVPAGSSYISAGGADIL
jgi:hypothetical protein